MHAALSSKHMLSYVRPSEPQTGSSSAGHSFLQKQVGVPLTTLQTGRGKVHSDIGQAADHKELNKTGLRVSISKTDSEDCH